LLKLTLRDGDIVSVTLDVRLREPVSDASIELLSWLCVDEVVSLTLMVLLMDAKSLGDSAVTVMDGETEKENECEAVALAEGAIRLSVLETVTLHLDPETSELNERVPLCETESER
jgi:hypothetical protein